MSRKELTTTVELTGTTSTSVTPTWDRQMKGAGSSNSAGKPMVNILPFEFRLVRLTQQRSQNIYVNTCPVKYHNLDQEGQAQSELDQ